LTVSLIVLTLIRSKASEKAKKYGFGGKRGKHWKNPDAESNNDFSGWSTYE